MGTNAPTSEITSDSLIESTTEPSAGDNMGGMTGDETSTNEERVTYEVTTKPIETGSGNSSEITTKEPTTKNTESTTKQESTTATPTLPPSTTKKPEQTTKKPEQTTKKKEESTTKKKEESTTKKPEQTTKKPEETTTEIDYYSHSASDCADGIFPYWYQCVVHQRSLETREEILKAFLEGWNDHADNPRPCYADYCPNKWTYENLDPVLCEEAMKWSKTMAEEEELFHSGLTIYDAREIEFEGKLGYELTTKEGVGVAQNNTYEEIYLKGYTLHHHIIDERPFRAFGIGYALAENGKMYFTVAAILDN